MSDKTATSMQICVLGANGQVGLEVSLFLAEWDSVGVIPVCRTQYGSALLRRLGLECRHGQMLAEREAGELMRGATLIADFGWPPNAVGKLDGIARRIRNAIRNAPMGAPYVFISTQSVYRLDPTAPRFSAYRLSKRYAERVALREGRKAGRPVFVLRLGEVHGALQRVSKAIVQGFRPETAFVPALNSYTVFTYSVAEALVNIAAGKEVPGVYTVMSGPEWRWPEVHAYYAAWAGLSSRAIEEVVSSKPVPLLMRLLRHGRAWLKAELFLKKDLIEYWGTRLFPSQLMRLRLRYYRTNAASEISNLFKSQVWRPYGQRVEVPGNRLCSLSDVRPFILERNRSLESRLRSVAP